jgi:hypothetical protein
LKSFFDSGNLIFTKAPLGATQSVLPAGVDKKTALYSPEAAGDRRVEMVIEEVK